MVGVWPSGTPGSSSSFKKCRRDTLLFGRPMAGTLLSHGPFARLDHSSDLTNIAERFVNEAAAEAGELEEKNRPLSGRVPALTGLSVAADQKRKRTRKPH